MYLLKIRHKCVIKEILELFRLYVNEDQSRECIEGVLGGS